jgi:hypothetical protein
MSSIEDLFLSSLKPTLNQKSVEQILDRHEQWRKKLSDGQRAVFSQADLQGRDFSQRDLTGARFTACDLRGANLQKCNLSFATFLCCDLRTADFRFAQGASIQFHGSDFREANLQEMFAGIDSNFTATDLRGAKMQGSHFKKADFGSAWLEPSDIKGARFEEAFSPSGLVLDGSMLSPERMPDLAGTLKRQQANPGLEKSLVVQAYDQGSGPALFKRLEAIERAKDRGPEIDR